jgi:hypothetical protein
MEVQEMLQRLADLNPELDQIVVELAAYEGSNCIDEVSGCRNVNDPEGLVPCIAEYATEDSCMLCYEGGTGTLTITLRPSLSVNLVDYYYERVRRPGPGFRECFAGSTNVLDKLFNIV